MMVIFYGFLAHMIVLLIGVICAFLGVRLLRSAGAAFERVIPRDDFPVLAEAVVNGKSEAIDQYVRLSSLSGFTGTFTKLGLTGLPLTTVSLTLIFSILSLFAPGSWILRS
jgi:hypothetical protein